MNPLKKEKKRKHSKAARLELATNFALVAIVVSVGAVCLFPVDSAVTADGRENGVYRNANAETNGVSLMFNVYWGTEEVHRILDTLKMHEAKATFFVGGCWADDNTACLNAILSDGHELGNHGYFHKDHAKLTLAQNLEEIGNCNRFVELATGYKITLFAPPSGAYDGKTLEAAAQLNMKTILWSRDTIDWRDKDVSTVYSRATKNIQGGDFVLMHPMQATADALDEILNYYEKNGLRTVTVSENLEEKG